ncbi:hypothetical protein FXO38_15020 [Capsicum annuum]|nr:hypothetical protein FXO38_15020 [Capsicum annuum]KAF3662163.1 hypothetical protein FXO37_12571 [Capsicum annuum]
MWSQKIFKQIGDQCGGFIETEEETSLKNHLHWARLKVKGDGKSIPPEIEVSSEGVVYTIPIWVESPVTFRMEKENSESGRYKLGGDTEKLSLLVKDTAVMGPAMCMQIKMRKIQLAWDLAMWVQQKLKRIQIKCHVQIM